MDTLVKPPTNGNEKAKEFFRWEEYRWTSQDIDWRGGKVVSAGIDIGSVGSKAAVMVDGKLYATANMRTGAGSADSAKKVLDWALEGTGLSQDSIHYIVGTGYGRLRIPIAKRAITEIGCHALGANFVYGSTVRTILDVGGQDCKAIKCDERGKVLNFVMNDKCAAGTGRGMETMAQLLSVPIVEIGTRSLEVDEEPEPTTSLCVIFAKSEAVSLLRRGWDVNKVLASYCRGMAIRIAELLAHVQMEEDFAITGGQSKNIGLVRRLETMLGVKALVPKEGRDPQLAGAIGAALFAKATHEKAVGVR